MASSSRFGRASPTTSPCQQNHQIHQMGFESAVTGTENMSVENNQRNERSWISSGNKFLDSRPISKCGSRVKRCCHVDQLEARIRALEHHITSLNQKSGGSPSSAPILATNLDCNETIIVSAAVNGPLYEYCKKVLSGPQAGENLEPFSEDAQDFPLTGHTFASSVNQENSYPEEDNVLNEFFDFSQFSTSQGFDDYTTPTPSAEAFQVVPDFNAGPDITSTTATNMAMYLPGTVAPFTSPQPASTPNQPRRAYSCAVCGKKYSRTTDLHRHERIHDPNAERHACPTVGCKYSGMNGMLRKDKLEEHQRRLRHWA